MVNGSWKCSCLDIILPVVHGMAFAQCKKQNIKHKHKRHKKCKKKQHQGLLLSFKLKNPHGIIQNKTKEDEAKQNV